MKALLSDIFCEMSQVLVCKKNNVTTSYYSISNEYMTYYNIAVQQANLLKVVLSFSFKTWILIFRF